MPRRCATSATASPSSSPRRSTQARDAAELVEVDYEPLPAVVNLEDAAKDGAPKVWEDCPQGNVGFRLMFGNKDATDAAFAKAKHVVKLRVENNRLSPVAMEPRVAIGDYNAADDQYTLYATSAEPARRAHGDVAHLPRAGEPDPRRLARRRRRLRPEGRTVPGRRAGAVGVAQASAAR